MLTGLALQHVVPDPPRHEGGTCDVAVFLGMIPPGAWPAGARAGDVVRLEPGASGEAAPARIDPLTGAAVRAFLDNGGTRCTVYGSCLERAGDLLAPDPLHAALDALAHDEHAALLAVPPLAWVAPEARDAGLATAAALLRHCREVGHRFLVLDAPRGADEDATAGWAGQLRVAAGEDASFGALYFPWLVHPGGVVLPPSGAVAGVYARTALAHAPFGVRVAPANVVVEGCLDAQIGLSWRDGARLLARGVNPILVQSGRGVVIAGARTLSDDPRWRQLVARRIVSLITERLRDEAAWAVFERLRPELYDAIARSVRARLDAFWSAGLLTGRVAGEEYQVWCDAALDGPEVRDAGQVTVRVSLRPVSSTERIEIALRLDA